MRTTLVMLCLALLSVGGECAEPASLTVSGSPASRALQQKLAERVSVDFVGVPIATAIDRLARKHDFAIRWEQMATKPTVGEGGKVFLPHADEIVPNGKVTLQVESVSLRSLLNLITRQADLSWSVVDGRVLVTTTAALESRLYPVGDLLVSPSRPRYSRSQLLDYDSLIETITGIVASNSWSEVGGEGRIKPVPGADALLVVQSRAVHESLEELLVRLRHVRDEQFPSSGSVPTAKPFAGDEARDRIGRALVREMQLEVVEQPLDELLSALSKEFAIPIVLGADILELADAPHDVVITRRLKGMPLHEGLLRLTQDLLAPGRQAALVTRDEVLIVTTLDSHTPALTQQVYGVRDLLPSNLYDSLIENITSSVAPKDWSEIGGRGSIKPFYNATALVILQTDDAHRQIRQLLAGLRELRKEIGGKGIAPQAENRTQPNVSDVADDAGRTLVVHRLPRRLTNSFSISHTLGQAMPLAPTAVATKPPATLFQLDSAAHFCSGTFFNPNIDVAAAAQDLSEIIPLLIEPETWRPGNGTIFPFAGTLIVRQTPDVHRQIDEFFDKIDEALSP